MMTVTRLFVFGILLVSILGVAQAQQRVKSNPLPAKVDAYLRPYLSNRDFSGAVLIAKGSQTLFSKAYGMANYEQGASNTTRTRFPIASISKQFTAAAVMLLEQRGLLNTQDAIVRFIPDFPRAQQITIANLLTHTSGITGNMKTLLEIAQDPQAFHSLADLAEMIKKAGVASEPGVKTRYSNRNFVLLAFVIEKVSGQNYGEFLRHNIFNPLGMANTGNQEYLEVVKDLATGYEPGISGIDKAPLDDYWNNVGAGSIYSTVEDLYKWDRALYTDKLLTEASRKKMFTPILPGGYGYGWGVSERFGRKVLTHNGRTPGFAGDISRYVDEEAVTIFLGNIGSGAADLIRNGLGAILFGKEYAKAEKLVAVSIDETKLNQYVGEYQMSPGFSVTVRKVNDHLVLSAEGTPSSVLTPRSETTFFMRALYTTVIFNKDTGGKVISLVWRQGGQDNLAKKVLPSLH